MKFPNVKCSVALLNMRILTKVLKSSSLKSPGRQVRSHPGGRLREVSASRGWSLRVPRPKICRGAFPPAFRSCDLQGPPTPPSCPSSGREYGVGWIPARVYTPATRSWTRAAASLIDASLRHPSLMPFPHAGGSRTTAGPAA